MNEEEMQQRIDELEVEVGGLDEYIMALERELGKIKAGMRELL